jgi:hypothetical protein
MFHYVKKVFWNQQKSTFLHEENFNDDEGIQNIISDAIESDGFYTRFFWRLHTFFHVLRVTYHIIKNKPNNKLI